MPNMPGETFMSQGIKYILLHGPKGNLRPYVAGSAAALARQGARWLPKLGWAGLAICAIALIGAAIWYACKENE